MVDLPKDRKGGKMASNRCFLALLFFLLTGLTTSSFISDNALESRGSTGRTLLQAKKSCPVDFEFKNYTIITSQCKGPQYPPKPCCAAFKEFACPFADELNDLTNDCATTMFSYINLYGKYPPGLFASECRDNKQGLECPAQSPSQSDTASGGAQSLSQSDTASGQILRTFAPLLMLAVGFIPLLI